MTAVLVLVTALSHAAALLVIAAGALIAREAVREVLRHTPTDPHCVRYHKPRTWLGRWWFNRNRGRCCVLCIGRWSR